MAHLSPELSDIFDFFIALTICNTVVVTSPDQPRQKASSGASYCEPAEPLPLGVAPLVSVFLRGSTLPCLAGARSLSTTLRFQGVRWGLQTGQASSVALR